MNDFVSLLRQPDDIKIQTADSVLRFEEKREYTAPDVRVECVVQNGALAVILYPSKEQVLRLRLRFCGDQSGVRAVLGEGWTAMIPHQPMDSYFYALVPTREGEVLHGYGIKTGGNAFAQFCCDPAGITLWLDVRNGTGGAVLTKPLVCAEVVCREGTASEKPFDAAKAFCRQMCDAPKLPDKPLYGFNNWYWAYGEADADCVIRQAAYLAALCKPFSSPDHLPYMVMDDGWQIAHTRVMGNFRYNGGPWVPAADRFPSMKELAEQIHKAGCKAGLWFRPLLTLGHVPKEAVLPPVDGGVGLRLDPTHPFTLKRVEADVRRFADWGFDLIKFDFTADDFLCGHPDNIDVSHLYDRTLTNAQALKLLYEVIANAASDRLVMECGGVNHLSAGIFPISRCGDDTSGNLWEVTLRGGLHTFLKLPQNRTFHAADVDCAVFTDRVDHSLNLQYLQAAAICGCPAFASVKPDCLTQAEEQRLAEIFCLAAKHTALEDAEILDWSYAAAPSNFCYRGEQIQYPWYEEYGGSRRFMTFLN